MLALLASAPSSVARGQRPFPAQRAAAARPLPSDPPPRNVISWPIVSGSPLAPGTGLEPLQPPGAARAHPARSGGARGSFSLPSAGRLRGSGGVSAGTATETASGVFPGGGSVRLGVQGAGSPHARRECRAGPPFRHPGAQLVFRIPAPARTARQTPRTRHGWLRAVRRNTPSLASNQGGGHPSSTVRQ